MALDGDLLYNEPKSDQDLLQVSHTLLLARSVESRQPLYQVGSGEPLYRTKKSLQAEALFNIGRASTVHKSSQTEKDGSQRIVYNIGYFNKLLRANQCLQQLLRKAPDASHKILQSKLSGRWEQLQEMITKKIDDIETEEAHRIRIMQLLRRQRLEITMRQLKVHYFKMQQKRQDDMDVFRNGLKAKFTAEMDHKTKVIEDLRMDIRILQKQLEERILAAIVADKLAGQPEGALDKHLHAVRHNYTAAEAENVEIINRKLLLEAHVADRDEEIHRLTQDASHMEERIARIRLRFEEEYTEILEEIRQAKHEQEKMHEKRLELLAELAELHKVTPLSATLQRDLTSASSACEDAVNRVRWLQLEARMKATIWMRKLSLLEIAVREIRQEMFQIVYSKKSGPQLTEIKGKNPVILKGAITQDDAEESKENPQRMVFRGMKPGRVKRTSDARASQDRRKINFVSGAKSIDQLVANEANAGMDDLETIFSRESDADQLVVKVESVEEHIEDSADKEDNNAQRNRKGRLSNPLVQKELSLDGVLDYIKEEDELLLTSSISSGVVSDDSFSVRHKQRSFSQKTHKK